jgi:hypothetical protein
MPVGVRGIIAPTMCCPEIAAGGRVWDDDSWILIRIFSSISTDEGKVQPRSKLEGIGFRESLGELRAGPTAKCFRWWCG